MKEEFKVGQVFDGMYPPEAADWCNANKAMIVEIEPKDDVRRFEIQATLEPTVEELQARVRAKRNALLDATDKYVSVPDFPIDESTRNQYIDYRVYLRDYTESENWWLSDPLTFDEWVESGSENVQE